MSKENVNASIHDVAAKRRKVKTHCTRPKFASPEMHRILSTETDVGITLPV
jgi:hypothetical protein